MDAARLLTKFSRLKKALNKAQNRVATSVMIRQLGDTKRRVFVDGIASDNQLITSSVIAKGVRIGAYSQRQGKSRIKTGNQTGKVDLNQHGSLMSSLIVGKENGDIVLGFKDAKSRNIAASHESYRQKPIYKPTKEEKDRQKKIAVAEIRAIIKENFR